MSNHDYAIGERVRIIKNWFPWKTKFATITDITSFGIFIVPDACPKYEVGVYEHEIRRERVC